MQRSKPIREKDIAQCMHKYMLSKGIVLEDTNTTMVVDDDRHDASAFNNIIINDDGNGMVGENSQLKLGKLSMWLENKLYQKNKVTLIFNPSLLSKDCFEA